MPNAPKDPGVPSPPDSTTRALESLDFERAETASQSPPACAQCATPITDRYFTLGPHVLCESCHFAFQNAKAPGNAASRFFGAAALGTVAAAIGCALWMLVTQLTGYEIGLIAIAVGYLVGMAVHVGARRVGGMAHQLLAVFLTYSAIVMTYVPMIANEFIANESLRQQARTDLPGESQKAASDDRMDGGPADPVTGEDATDEVEAAVTRPGADEMAAWIAAIPLAYMLPFLMGFENAIGILIIGFALWQAYRMNARAKIDLQGPFRLEARDTELG